MCIYTFFSFDPAFFSCGAFSFLLFLSSGTALIKPPNFGWGAFYPAIHGRITPVMKADTEKHREPRRKLPVS